MQACRERATALKSQIARLDQKIDELTADKIHHQNSQADVRNEETLGLLKDLTAALEKSLTKLERSKRDRLDHLSYYDNMEQPAPVDPQT